jgi:hypothetical protein
MYVCGMCNGVWGGSCVDGWCGCVTHELLCIHQQLHNNIDLVLSNWPLVSPVCHFTYVRVSLPVIHIGGGGGMNFPSVPSGPPAGGSGQQGGDLDFDDLTKRFERLKGKK